MIRWVKYLFSPDILNFIISIYQENVNSNVNTRLSVKGETGIEVLSCYLLIITVSPYYL